MYQTVAGLECTVCRTWLSAYLPMIEGNNMERKSENFGSIAGADLILFRGGIVMKGLHLPIQHPSQHLEDYTTSFLVTWRSCSLAACRRTLVQELTSFKN